MAPLLCIVCRNIQFHRIPPFPKSFEGKEMYLGPGLFFLDLLRVYRLQRPDIFGLQYHQDLFALEKSAQSCTICSLVNAQVQTFLHNVHHGERVGNNGALYPDIKPKRYCFQITRRASRDGFVVWTDDGPNDCIWYVAVFGFAVQDGETTRTVRLHLDIFLISDSKKRTHWLKFLREEQLYLIPPCPRSSTAHSSGLATVITIRVAPQ
jgi:hypothetical protein